MDVVHTGPVFASIATDIAAAKTATVTFAAGTAGGLHTAGTADCDIVGTKLCCGESPFAVLLASGQWQRVSELTSTSHRYPFACDFCVDSERGCRGLARCFQTTR